MGSSRDSFGGEVPCLAGLVDEDGVLRVDIAGRGDVEALVRTFYRAAAMDDLLGPIFHDEVHDWNRHIAVITDFWMWQLFNERGYVGQPLLAHRDVHARWSFSDAHFQRWVELFTETIEDMFRGPVARAAIQRGQKMAAAMQRLLSGVHAAGDEPVGTYFTRPPR